MASSVRADHGWWRDSEPIHPARRHGAAETALTRAEVLEAREGDGEVAEESEMVAVGERLEAMERPKAEERAAAGRERGRAVQAGVSGKLPQTARAGHRERSVGGGGVR